MVDLNFRPLFSSPFVFANFGEAAKSLNKRLVKDIDVEIADYQGVTEERSFALNTCGWQSKSGLENSHSSFKELSVAISKCLFPMLSQSGIEDEYASKLKATGLWANVILAAGGFSEPHIHGTGKTLWTGVYYPAGPEEDLDNFDHHKHVIGESTPGSGTLVLKDLAFVQ